MVTTCLLFLKAFLLDTYEVSLLDPDDPANFHVYEVSLLDPGDPSNFPEVNQALVEVALKVVSGFTAHQLANADKNRRIFQSLYEFYHRVDGFRTMQTEHLTYAGLGQTMKYMATEVVTMYKNDIIANWLAYQER